MGRPGSPPVEAGPDDVVIGVAIAVPEPQAGELQRWRAEFGDPLASAIPAHVTLLPPTAVPTSSLDEVRGHLAGVARGCDAFAIHLRGTATFRPVSPVVFVQLAEGIGQCEELERAVRTGPLRRDLRFPYHPHVTVAHDVEDEALDRAFTTLAAWEARFAVEGFTLFQHGDDGVWRPCEVFGFDGRR